MSVSHLNTGKGNFLTKNCSEKWEASHEEEKKKQKKLVNAERIKKDYMYEFMNDCMNMNDQLNTCALDIGGTLIKVAYLNDKYIYDGKKALNDNISLKIKIKDNQYLHVHFFKINELGDALNYLLKNYLIKKKILLTGGGSYKFYFHIINEIINYEFHQRINASLQKKFIFFVSRFHYYSKLHTLTVVLQEEDESTNITTSKDKVPFNKTFLDSFANLQTVEIYYYNGRVDKQQGEDHFHVQTYNQEVCCEMTNNTSIENKIENEEEESEKKETFRGVLILRCIRKDEMHCVMNGIYKLFNVKKTIARYDFLLKTQVPVYLKPPHESFIIANIGSGISILLSNGINCYRRIGGTAIGGGTFLGLAQMILGKISFEELIRLATAPSATASRTFACSSPFDLKVKHIKKDAAGSSACMKGNEALATSFGFLSNILKKEQFEKKEQFFQHVAKSLITMISYNIGYLVHLLARIHGVRRIFFSGKYISNHDCIMESLTLGVHYYYMHYKKNQGGNYTPFKNNPAVGESKNVILLEHSTCRWQRNVNMTSKQCQFHNSEHTYREEIHKDVLLPDVLFLKHDGFLGVIGCFFS
ncbi:pantothenate kinase [Plasmodium gonderi]|uniref:Pantothenate kinase n=1 Tax=Plasmodium gonderi TaxID=77519 RepID=A0A1Y1JNI7_PLAGO|nr:pantothenate kinase [Plasmodium gonderi]GAW83015.1 pantothenate kinase [Plasmodium gonderi]